MTIGERIRELRLKHGYSQGDIAKMLGVSNQAIGKYEHGVVDNLPINRLKQIAQILDCDADYLLGYQDSPRKEIQPIQEDELSELKKELIKIVESLSEEEVAAVLRILKR